MQRFSSVASRSSSQRLGSPIHLSVLTSAVALALLPLAGCEKQPLPVGAVLPLSGADATYGQSTRRGMELAQEELQKTGRASNFIVTYRDSESDADTALTLYRQLLDERFLVTVGGITPDEARALAPVAEENERVVLSPTAHDQELGATNRYFYRLAPSAAVTGTTIATFASRDLDLDTMVLIAESKQQGDLLEEGLGSTFDRNGGEILGRFDLDEVEMDWTLEELGRMRPDAVTLAGWGGWLAESVKTLKAAGYRGKIFTPESFSAPSVREAAGRSARGVLIASSPFDPSTGDQGTQAFVEAYRTRYDEEPDLYAAAGWDTMLVLDAALAGHPNIPGEMRQWLRDDVKEIDGLIGHLQFNETGATTKYPRVYSVQNDLTLKDHSRWLEEEKQRIADKRRHLEEERRKLLREMAKPADDASTGDADAQGSSQIASSG